MSPNINLKQDQTTRKPNSTILGQKGTKNNIAQYVKRTNTQPKNGFFPQKYNFIISMEYI